ncbi:MAG: TIGR03617 family F420-dependent LLM class oxidoreductase [Ilumatobacteraceae bacterium]
MDDLREVPRRAREIVHEGFDGLWTAETKFDPFLPLLLAAEHTDAEIGTAIAVAFARNPMTVANLGWDLQTYSRGKFILGLGTQVKPHITRRFSMPFTQPVERMKEFVTALRAIWTAWNDGTRLQFEGAFYTHNLMTPYFNPGPQPFGQPQIMLAAVGPKMAQAAGEVSDGILSHVFTTPKYVHEVVLPALERGLTAAGRHRSDFSVKLPIFLITGRNAQEFERAEASIRKEIAFYASTPTYRAVLDIHGWGSVQDELVVLSRQGEWEAMGDLVTDEMLDTFAVTAKPADVVSAVRARYGDTIDRLGFHIPYDTNNELPALIAAGRSEQPDGDDAARAASAGPPDSPVHHERRS